MGCLQRDGLTWVHPNGLEHGARQPYSTAPRRRSTPVERPSSCRRDAISRWKAASPPSLHGLPSAAGAVHRTRLGVPAHGRSAWWLGRSGCRPHLRHPVHVLGQRPVSSVRCPVRATGVHACLSTGPVSSVRCGRLSVQVSAVRRPLSGVRCGRLVWASGVCALPRARCPAEVRSWSAAVGRQPYGWDGRGRRGRPLRPCPARRLPESEPGARSWRRRCWASRASIWTWPSSWEVVGSGQLDRVADQDRPGAREDRSLVGAGAARLASRGRLIGMRRANRSAGLAG
jgi:hypothetical protein